jgi:hypothetical protein
MVTKQRNNELVPNSASGQQAVELLQSMWQLEKGGERSKRITLI